MKALDIKTDEEFPDCGMIYRCDGAGFLPKISLRLTNRLQYDLVLEFRDLMAIMEMTVKYLNQTNSELQQHIRTQKDKQNQKIVEQILQIAKTGQSEYTKGIINEPKYDQESFCTLLTYITSKDIKDIKP